MGDFNKIGFHSGLPILGGNDIVLFICHISENELDKTPISVDDWLTPICLPIHGKYSGYGDISNIEKDNNVSLLERLYGGKIERLLSFINDFGQCKLDDLKKNDKLIEYVDFLNKIGIESNLVFIMEHESVYRNMIDVFNKPMININSWGKGANIGDYWLSKLGFNKVGTNNYSSVYKYTDSEIEYYVESRGYTPPSIMLDKKIVWHGYGGLKEFIDKFNELAKTNIQFTEHTTIVDAVYECYEKEFKNGQLKNLEIVSKDRLDYLREQYKDNAEMLDYINNEVNHFNFFRSMKSLDYNDLHEFHRYCDFVGRKNMCVYNDVNILIGDFKTIVCDFIKFNRGLKLVGGYYKISAYCIQSINDFKDELEELYMMNLKIIKGLTPINE